MNHRILKGTADIEDLPGRLWGRLTSNPSSLTLMIRKGTLLILALFMAVSLSAGTAFADRDKKDRGHDDDEVITIVGPAGPQGVAGLQGLIGLTGAAGTNGTNGVDGAAGATGPAGSQGLIGLTGAAGTNGTNGIDGAAGATGPTGPQGLIGLTGAAGTNGTNGIDGAAGATGPQGLIGLTGAAGTNGTNGVDGATGPQGPVGANGFDGAPGAQGPPGVTGPQGPIGTVGEDPLARDGVCTVFNSLVLKGSLGATSLPGYCTAWKIAFVTSTKQSSNLGGLVGADAICQGLATAKSLPGTYMAWVSDATGSPTSRFTRSTGAYVMPNGIRVADNWTDLTDGTIQNSIKVNEAGATVDTTFLNGNLVWTNTTTGGAVTTPAVDGSCANWTGAATVAGVGHQGSADQGWSGYYQWSNYCTAQNRLYCFQQ